MSYNGHANYETWNVNLWLDNDEPMYREKMRFLRRATIIDADSVEEFVREMMPNGTPDFDSVKDYNKVDWEEIAEGWREEMEE